jgi:hypothetical protein
MRNAMRPHNAGFWRDAARSLPVQVQSRYAGYFESAETWEFAFDRIVEIGARLKLALTRKSQTQAA